VHTEHCSVVSKLLGTSEGLVCFPPDSLTEVQFLRRLDTD
jgi:hypothetical protein